MKATTAPRPSARRRPRPRASCAIQAPRGRDSRATGPAAERCLSGAPAPRAAHATARRMRHPAACRSHARAPRAPARGDAATRRAPVRSTPRSPRRAGARSPRGGRRHTKASARSRRAPPRVRPASCRHLRLAPGQRAPRAHRRARRRAAPTGAGPSRSRPRTATRAREPRPPHRGGPARTDSAPATPSRRGRCPYRTAHTPPTRTAPNGATARSRRGAPIRAHTRRVPGGSRPAPRDSASAAARVASKPATRLRDTRSVEGAPSGMSDRRRPRVTLLGDPGHL